ncbi:MAG: hypothetical protein A3C50_01625 [Candidatus Staskawiczbacteria bacterium RIFCSPHIGHO2_02_FULL_43_16]|uniref:HTH arsR-type domain-containing protein n=1 Tax=Candidatus Staskawiczbacteria bacterium RIFCSPHIGHO2_01_FULL_41_41 TaxID=1802203 RepID=A0A1G2HVB0_9BACT|nr:MAG: hypothetical protein A2822_04040 [Candidatus Staskawiczbacteria bacterium RIFCSPHIGHO2_01_FULL_41_41]OGZ69080.1 MAG: hypothetical protein A3C50_01625 [Candidatus Staskawiczbacteria bacterium RIFCSPHIGHO2_02_FULL_43_16]OGZ74493.1 MAG: hypothetical protein A3A12_01865 [Candidatus Staskawiczbacteria bacterium RIFCSPLOWO2_01_FULL_43_17b]
MEKLKTPKQIERHIKGVANHRRIQILLLIADSEGITLDEIIEKVEANPKTIGEHTRRLHNAGLVEKNYNGRFIQLSLSPYGKIFIKFIKEFQKYHYSK